MLRFFFFGVALFAFYIAYYLSQIATQAAVANLLELSLSIDANAFAIAALGFAMFGLVIGRDWADDERRNAENLHFKHLKHERDAIPLRALIRMRAALPRGISLKQAYAVNHEFFTEKEFVRRLLEP